MLKIGFIDLDTSHPRSFAKRLNAMPDVQVTGVFDRGRVKSADETVGFAAEFGIEIYGTALELARSSDGVMVLSADWETHFDDVMTCLEVGTACYCDKPVFGSRDEISQFLEAARTAEMLFMGGSGWRCPTCSTPPAATMPMRMRRKPPSTGYWPPSTISTCPPHRHCAAKLKWPRTKRSGCSALPMR